MFYVATTHERDGERSVEIADDLDCLSPCVVADTLVRYEERGQAITVAIARGKAIAIPVYDNTADGDGWTDLSA